MDLNYEPSLERLTFVGDSSWAGQTGLRVLRQIILDAETAVNPGHAVEEKMRGDARKAGSCPEGDKSDKRSYQVPADIADN